MELIRYSLVYLDLELSSLKAEHAQTVPDARMDSLKQLVQEGIRELRDVLGTLRANAPAAAAASGASYAQSLQQLLQDKADSYRNRCGASVHIDANGCKQIVRPAPQAAPHVDSIVSEAISNAVAMAMLMRSAWCFVRVPAAPSSPSSMMDVASRRRLRLRAITGFAPWSNGWKPSAGICISGPLWAVAQELSCISHVPR